MSERIKVLMIQEHPEEKRALLFFNKWVTQKVYDDLYSEEVSYCAVEVIGGVIFPINHETHVRLSLDPLYGSRVSVESHDPREQVSELIEYVYDSDLKTSEEHP